MVYPRVCGGNGLVRTNPAIPPGLSPRVRGKRRGRRIPARPNRSIPACAGETATDAANDEWDKVYPRVCGGNIGRVVPAARAAGLSPRVRGKPLGRKRPREYPRSIPACAGETTAGTNPAPVVGVYPRVCGGNRRITPGDGD